MINGDLNVFLDKLYLGEDLEILYNEIHYFIQDSKGLNPKFRSSLVVYDYDKGYLDGLIFQSDSNSLIECVDSFLNAKIWNGRKFMDAECEIEWIG